jgi:hypothetical protein
MDIIKNLLSTIIDSIETSMTLELYDSKEKSAYAHIYQSKLVKFPMSKCKDSLKNFNPDKRLKSSAEEAYPLNDRERGDKDISSVNYYREKIKNGDDIPPIWIIKRDCEYTLLDGVHRIVASHIEGKSKIIAYVIK